MNQQGYIFMGMSGVGKTSLGKKFAKLINYFFLDSDHIMEYQRGLPLATIVDGYLDKHEFIQFEERVLYDLDLKETILSTGGSACYAGDAIKSLKDRGVKVIYLDITWEILSKRIMNFDKRGVILFEPNYEMEYYIRKKKYERLADYTIECGKYSVSELLEKIVEQVVGKVY